MDQLNFHSANPPPKPSNISIIQRLIETYKLWDEIAKNFPKKSRLRGKIDSLFIEILELSFTASYLAKDKKLPFVQKIIGKLDTLKFFLQIAWEIKQLDNKKYPILATPLSEIGRMLGGWMKQLEKQTPPK
jgi:hypothetical protein